MAVELIDGQTLVPSDYAPLLRSLKKTGKLILASDACERGSYLHTIAGQVGQMGFDCLVENLEVLFFSKREGGTRGKISCPSPPD